MLGEKYEVAKKVNIKLVNHWWLEEWYFTTASPDLTRKPVCSPDCLCFDSSSSLFQLKGMRNSPSQ
jgi:hypothetical protein